jgi:serine protease Do
MQRRALTLLLMGSLVPLVIGADTALAEAPVPERLWTEKPVAKGLDPDGPVSMRAFAKLAKELSPAVVNINVERKAITLPFMAPSGGTGLGTGFIVHASGYVLTNNHVIAGADSITVRLANEHEYPAKVVGAYEPLDVALLKVEPSEPLVAAPLGSSDTLEIGEWVIAIGNPFGLNHTVTAGIVSAKGRREVTPGNEAAHARFIQTDASINPGNSGGPLINIRGEVVGINTAINAAGQGIGFAVPVDMIKTVLPQLAKGRVNRSYLGVMVGPVNKDIASRIGMEKANGALVTDVKPETPASRAGVEKGDVIMSFDGRAIDHWSDLPWLASTAGSARPLKLQVNRGGKARELSVTLAPFPEEKQVAKRDPSTLGIEVAPLAVEKAKEIGIEPGEGVLIEAVKKDSAGAAIGLQPGDVIVQVNYETIRGGAAGFAKLVAGVPDGQPLAMTVRRGPRFIFKVVR